MQCYLPRLEQRYRHLDKSRKSQASDQREEKGEQSGERSIFLESATFPEKIDRAVSTGDGILGGYFTRPPPVPSVPGPNRHSKAVRSRARERARKRERHRATLARKGKDTSLRREASRKRAMTWNGVQVPMHGGGRGEEEEEGEDWEMKEEKEEEEEEEGVGGWDGEMVEELIEEDTEEADAEDEDGGGQEYTDESSGHARRRQRSHDQRKPRRPHKAHKSRQESSIFDSSILREIKDSNERLLQEQLRLAKQLAVVEEKTKHTRKSQAEWLKDLLASSKEEMEEERKRLLDATKEENEKLLKEHKEHSEKAIREHGEILWQRTVTRDEEKEKLAQQRAWEQEEERLRVIEREKKLEQEKRELLERNFEQQIETERSARRASELKLEGVIKARQMAEQRASEAATKEESRPQGVRPLVLTWLARSQTRCRNSHTTY